MPRRNDFRIRSELPIPPEGHPWARVVDVEVELGDTGQLIPKGPWTVIRDGDGVEILPLTSDDQVVLVVQRRIPVGVARHIEVPQGKVGDEEPGQAGLRELREETGHAPKSGTMTKIYPWVNRFHARSDQWMHIYVARDVEKVTEEIDRDEILEILIVPFETAYQMIGQEGGIYEAATIIALQWEKIRRLEEEVARLRDRLWHNAEG